MTWIKWTAMFSTLMLFTDCQGVEVESICPVFVDKKTVTIECRINSSEIIKPRCLANPTTVSYFFTTPIGNASNTLCKADFPNTTCDISKSGCGCTSKSGFMYIYNYNFTANESLHSNVSFRCSVDCVGAFPPVSQNHSSCAFIIFARPPTTTPVPDNDCPAGCYAAIIIAIVLGLAIIIIIIIIIYKKWIKERIKGNEFLCCCKAHKKHKKSCCGWYPKDKCPSKKTPANTSVTVTRQVGPGGKTLESITVTRQVGPDGTTLESITATSEERPNESVTVTSLAVPKGTKLEPIATPIQEGHKGAKLSPIPKLTNTENGGNVQSPEKKKRRKKKKMKETFQEVGGASASKEEESTVNGHSATQNDNPDILFKISQRTDNGPPHESRRLPMPKTSNMTSVERNSIITESETPRWLPPAPQ